MVLSVKPVRLRESLYLLIPMDIAKLVGAGVESSFQLTLRETEGKVQLIYEMKQIDRDPIQLGFRSPVQSAIRPR